MLEATGEENEPVAASGGKIGPVEASGLEDELIELVDTPGLAEALVEATLPR